VRAQQASLASAAVVTWVAWSWGGRGPGWSDWAEAVVVPTWKRSVGLGEGLWSVMSAFALVFEGDVGLGWCGRADSRDSSGA